MGEVVNFSKKDEKPIIGLMLGYLNKGEGVHCIDGIVKYENGKYTYLTTENVEESHVDEFNFIEGHTFLTEVKEDDVGEGVNVELRGIEVETLGGDTVYGYFSGETKEGAIFRLNKVVSGTENDYAFLRVEVKDTDEDELQLGIELAVIPEHWENHSSDLGFELLESVHGTILAELAVMSGMVERKPNLEF